MLPLTYSSLTASPLLPFFLYCQTCSVQSASAGLDDRLLEKLGNSPANQYLGTLKEIYVNFLRVSFRRLGLPGKS